MSYYCELAKVVHPCEGDPLRWYYMKRLVHELKDYSIKFIGVNHRCSDERT